jgi:molybdopterin-containing oxidoreductase family iron-sulfur binding subunit
MKRVPYTYGADQSDKKYWRSLNEFSETTEFKEAVAREFPDGASVLEDPVSRRSFIGLMGASLGLAGLAGCRRPEEKILPYNKRPEDIIEGNPQSYATVFPWGQTAIGLLVTSYEGRPTKVEGNPSHPHSLGGANTFAQASLLELYDPDRAVGPSQKGGAPSREWTEANAALQARAAAAAAKGGEGIAILTESHRSPSLAAQLTALRTKWPNAKVYRYDPLSRQNERDGNRLAFGSPFETAYELADAKVIAAIDSDLLLTDGSPLRQARQFADNRRMTSASDAMNRLYVAESRFSITGASADHRARVARKDVPALVFALAKALSSIPGVTLSVAVPEAKLAPNLEPFVRELANDLGRNHGSSVVAVGPAQPPVVHAVVGLINHALGNIGKTVKYLKPFDGDSDGPSQLLNLAMSMKKDEVETLIILGGNPVVDAPSDVDFAAALSKVKFSAHLSGLANETSKATTWHYPRSHYLESWGDATAADGTAAIMQPLISPLFSSRTDVEIVETLLGGTRKGYEVVRDTWRNGLGVEFEGGWRRALHDGVVLNSTQGGELPAPSGNDLSAFAKAALSGPGVEVTFHPDSHAWDGRFANVGWMQEMPDQMTKESWGNAAMLSPVTAKALGVTDGDYIQLALVSGKSIKIPIVVAPGQADDSVAVTIGQGRTIGTVATGVGVDVGAIRTSTGFFVTTGAVMTKTGEREDLARTQEHHTMEGRPLVREATLVDFKKNPDFAPQMVEVTKINLFAGPDADHNFAEIKYDGLKWGMAIDLNSCIGCNACMVACQAENNIPLVGKDGVIRGREMHWIRIDRYYEGADPSEPRALLQPIGCQHCENAPCELVCPVAATEHSPEGLNDMAYNRCVGTRYCANNCPYKVRRFNFFAYNRDVPELRKMQFNPNVTVRSRGVMEKCTYCVQRIQEGKIAAKRENRFIVRKGETIPEIRDGDVVSACAQTCPTQAIKFGDLNDPSSEVAKHQANSRSYGLLAEINTRPRTSFLARIRNVNPAMEKA